MKLTFFDYEIPVLRSLVQLGGSAKTKDVYPVVENIMKDFLDKHPEEYGHYKIQTDIIWKNKTQWAREYMKKKGQIDGPKRGIWAITSAGKERLRILEKTGKDPDAGRSILEGVEESISESNTTPERAFDELSMLHDSGGILGVKGIVYEPINEQGVILLFAALCDELGFMIEGIRPGFPDAQLRRKNEKGNYSLCRAEFEFKSSQYKAHNHPLKGCDLIICWENDWKDCPIEILELKDEVRKF